VPFRQCSDDLLLARLYDMIDAESSRPAAMGRPPNVGAPAPRSPVIGA